MWSPVEQLKGMTRDERLAFLSFTSDDVREQVVTYLLDAYDGCDEARNELRSQVEFFKKHNKKLVEENSTFKKKNKFERYKSNKLRSQVADLVEKLKSQP